MTMARNKFLLGVRDNATFHDLNKGQIHAEANNAAKSAMVEQPHRIPYHKWSIFA